MALSNAERQAAWRARQRLEVVEAQPDPTPARLRARILELEEDVRHLKAELAKRGPGALNPPHQSHLSEPDMTAAWARSRPVPKSG